MEGSANVNVNVNVNVSETVSVMSVSGTLLEQEEIAAVLRLVVTKKVSEGAALVLTLITIMLILIATLGNAFTIYVIVTQREMRSAKYGFILNLAVSDLLLCLFTQPFNLVLTLERTWRFGVFLCQFIMMCQGTSVFASSFSITAIAVDRLHVVLRRTATQSRVEEKRVMPSIICIWLISVTLALPCYFFSELQPFELESVPAEQIAAVSASLGISTLDMCKSRQDEFYVKFAAFYSLFCLIVQFLINFLIITGTHCVIWLKVVQRRKKMAQSRSYSNPHRTAPVKRASSTRRKKAKYLLICIAVTFLISWLPLNVLNLALDFTEGPNPNLSPSPTPSPAINADRFSDTAEQRDTTLFGETVDNIADVGLTASRLNDAQPNERGAYPVEEYDEAAGSNASAGESSESLNSNIDLLFPAANVLSLLSAVLNPIYYGWFNHRFRLHFLKCISYVIGRPLTNEREAGTARRSLSDDGQHSRMNTNAHTHAHTPPRSTCAAAAPSHLGLSKENGLCPSPNLNAPSNGDLHSMQQQQQQQQQAPASIYVKNTHGHPSKAPPCAVCTKEGERAALCDTHEQNHSGTSLNHAISQNGATPTANGNGNHAEMSVTAEACACERVLLANDNDCVVFDCGDSKLQSTVITSPYDDASLSTKRSAALSLKVN